MYSNGKNPSLQFSQKSNFFTQNELLSAEKEKNEVLDEKLKTVINIVILDLVHPEPQLHQIFKLTKKNLQFFTYITF